MVNNNSESKLDETVRNTLNNYEAQYDPSDWSRMESMLDAAPKANPFKWSHAITVAIGVVVIGGGYALFNILGTSEKNTNTEQPASPAPEKNIVKESPKPVTAPPSAPAVNNTMNAVTKEEQPAPALKTPEKNTAPAEMISKPETKTALKENKKGNSKTAEKQIETAPIIEPHDKIMSMGNEPIFGDMLDSSKGIVNETKEKEETKKAAKAKKNTPVGWNQFMLPHVNADSLKKNREQRDSLKTE